MIDLSAYLYVGMLQILEHIRVGRQGLLPVVTVHLVCPGLGLGGSGFSVRVRFYLPSCRISGGAPRNR